MSAPAALLDATAIAVATPTTSAQAREQYNTARRMCKITTEEGSDYRQSTINKYERRKRVAWRRLTNLLINESDGGRTGRNYHEDTGELARQTMVVFNIPLAVWRDTEKYAKPLHLSDDDDEDQPNEAEYIHKYTKAMIKRLIHQGFDVTLWHQMMRMLDDESGERLDDELLSQSMDDGADTPSFHPDMVEDRDDAYGCSDIVLSARLAYHIGTQQGPERLVRLIETLNGGPVMSSTDGFEFEGRMVYIMQRLPMDVRDELEAYVRGPRQSWERPISYQTKRCILNGIGEMDIENFTGALGQEAMVAHVKEKGLVDIMASYLAQTPNGGFGFEYKYAREQREEREREVAEQASIQAEIDALDKQKAALVLRLASTKRKPGASSATSDDKKPKNV